MDDDLLERLKVKPRVLSPSEILRERQPYRPDAGDGFAGYEERRSENSRLVPASETADAPAKKSDPLPRPGEPYRACARFLNRLQERQTMLHLVRKDWTVESFAYGDLRRVRLLQGEAGKGPVLVLRFVEAVITEVQIEGRYLANDIHYYVSEQLMPWLWERPKDVDFGDENAPVIDRFTITPAG